MERLRFAVAAVLALVVLGEAYVPYSTESTTSLLSYNRRLLNLAEGFPWCNCLRALSGSPYRLALGGPVEVSDDKGNVKKFQCFKLLTVDASGCPGGFCCNVGVYKIELNAAPACGDSVGRNFLWLGHMGAAEFKVWPDKSKAVIKMAPMDLTRAQVDDATEADGGLDVCLELKEGSCSLGELLGVTPTQGIEYSISNDNQGKYCCPVGIIPNGDEPLAPGLRSPPPPVPKDFPACKCNTKQPSSMPWRASVASRSPIDEGETVCLAVSVDPQAAADCNDKWGCCEAGLDKIEFSADLFCQGTIANMKVNGKPSGAFGFDRVRSVLKLMNLDLSYEEGVAGAEVCFDVRHHCSTLEQVCGSDACLYAAFNPPGNDCCPVAYLG